MSGLMESGFEQWKEEGFPLPLLSFTKPEDQREFELSCAFKLGWEYASLTEPVVTKEQVGLCVRMMRLPDVTRERLRVVFEAWLSGKTIFYANRGGGEVKKMLGLEEGFWLDSMVDTLWSNYWIEGEKEGEKP